MYDFVYFINIPSRSHNYPLALLVSDLNSSRSQGRYVSFQSVHLKMPSDIDPGYFSN